MLELTEEERDQLVRWERRRKSSQGLALRTRIVLRCAEGHANREVAAACGVSPATVGKWRRRFCELRLDGLSDDPRPGRPATITARQVEDVLVATLESTPENATHWSRAKMAERSGLSESTIGRIWRAFGLAPHRTDTFKLSTDPLFVEKVYDVVGLYVNPPEAAVVLCVDEKAPVLALTLRHASQTSRLEIANDLPSGFGSLTGSSRDITVDHQTSQDDPPPSLHPHYGVGSPGASQLPAPTDPGVTVSRHRALLTSRQYARTHFQWANRPGSRSCSPVHHRLNRL